MRNARRGGPFADLGGFLNRVQHKDLNKKSLESLAKSGALESLGAERNAVLKNIDDILKFVADAKKTRASSQSSLFAGRLPASTLRLKTAPPAGTPKNSAGKKNCSAFTFPIIPLTLIFAKWRKIRYNQ